MAFSHDDKKEVFNFFNEILARFDDFVYYENIRGHVSKASLTVKKYVIQKCKGEDLLEYFKRRKNYFIVENNNVALKSKIKKIKKPTLSSSHDTNIHSPHKNPKEQISKTTETQFGELVLKPIPTEEDEEREKYENYSIKYFKAYLNRNKRVNIEWIDYNNLPKKVKRLLEKYFNKKVRAFFLSLPTEFCIDHENCVSLRVISSTSEDTAQNEKPKIINEHIKLEKSRPDKPTSNAEAQKSITRYNCINFFVKILRQKHEPYPINKLGGYLSRASMSVRDHIKLTYKKFDDFFKDSPTIFQTDINGKVALTSSYVEVLGNLKKLLKGALSNPSDGSLKNSVDSLLHLESQCESKADTLTEKVSSLYLNVELTTNTKKTLSEANKDNLIAPCDDSDFELNSVQLNDLSLNNLDTSGAKSENNSNKTDMVIGENFFSCEDITLDNKVGNNRFSNCLQSNSISNGNESNFLLLSENSRKKLFSDEGLDKIILWEDEMYLETSESKIGLQSLGDNVLNEASEHKADKNMKQKNLESADFELNTNPTNTMENTPFENITECDYDFQRIIHLIDTDASETVTELSKKRYLNGENSEILEKYKFSKKTDEVVPYLNCVKTEDNFNLLENTIFTELPEDKISCDRRSDFLNNAKIQVKKELTCDSIKVTGSNGFSDTVSNNEIDELLQVDKSKIAELESKKKLEFAFKEDLSLLADKSSELSYLVDNMEISNNSNELVPHCEKSEEKKISESDEDLKRVGNLKVIKDKHLEDSENNDFFNAYKTLWQDEHEISVQEELIVGSPIKKEVVPGWESNKKENSSQNNVPKLIMQKNIESGNKLDSENENDVKAYLDLLCLKSDELSEASGKTIDSTKLYQTTAEFELIQNYIKPDGIIKIIKNSSSSDTSTSKLTEDTNLNDQQGDLINNDFFNGHNQLETQRNADKIVPSKEVNEITAPGDFIDRMINNVNSKINKPLQNESNVTKHKIERNRKKLDSGFEDDEFLYLDLLFDKSNEIFSTNFYISYETSENTNNFTPLLEKTEGIQLELHNEKLAQNLKVINACFSDLSTSKLTEDTNLKDKWGNLVSNDFSSVHNQLETQPNGVKKDVPSSVVNQLTEPGDFIDGIINNVNVTVKPLQNDELNVTKHKIEKNRKKLDSGFEEDECLYLDLLFDKSNEIFKKESVSLLKYKDKNSISGGKEDNINDTTCPSKHSNDYSLNMVENNNLLVTEQTQLSNFSTLISFLSHDELRSVHNIQNKNLTVTEAQLSNDSTLTSFLSHDELPSVHNIQNENLSVTEQEQLSNDSTLTSFLSHDELPSVHNTQNENLSVSEQTQLSNEGTLTSFLSHDELPVIENGLELPPNEKCLQNKELVISNYSTNLLGSKANDNSPEINVILGLSKKHNEFSDDSQKEYNTEFATTVKSSTPMMRQNLNESITTEKHNEFLDEDSQNDFNTTFATTVISSVPKMCKNTIESISTEHNECSDDDSQNEYNTAFDTIVINSTPKMCKNKIESISTEHNEFSDDDSQNEYNTEFDTIVINSTPKMCKNTIESISTEHNECSDDSQNEYNTAFATTVRSSTPEMCQNTNESISAENHNKFFDDVSQNEYNTAFATTVISSIPKMYQNTDEYILTKHNEFSDDDSQNEYNTAFISTVRSSTPKMCQKTNESISTEHNKYSIDDTQNEYNLAFTTTVKTSTPKMCQNTNESISTESILKTGFRKITENGEEPLSEKFPIVEYPLQPLRAEVTLLTTNSCLAQTCIESRLQIIYFTQSVYYCEKHESCTHCFNTLVIGDTVSCFVALSEIQNKIWLAFMASKEGNCTCCSHEGSEMATRLELESNQVQPFSRSMSKEFLKLDLDKTDDNCNSLETASFQSEAHYLNVPNFQSISMQQFRSLKEFNNCSKSFAVFKKVTDTKDSTSQTDILENSCQNNSSRTCQTDNYCVNKAENMCQTDFISDIKTFKNTADRYSQTVSTGGIMITEYYHL